MRGSLYQDLTYLRLLEAQVRSPGVITTQWDGQSFPGGGGVTQSRKGYRLWPDYCGAVAVASKNC